MRRKDVSIGIVMFLAINGIIGYLSMETLCEVFSWSIPIWFELVFGYLFAILLAPITIIILLIRLTVGF